VLVRAALLKIRAHTYGMPGLRSSNVDHGRDGDAPVQVAADHVVVGRAPHGNALPMACQQSSSRPNLGYVTATLSSRIESQ
jgi:hypothetical protein